MARSPPPALLDVRDMLARGQEPFAAIMAAVAALAPGQSLRLVVPFRPLPLVALMREQGYAHAIRPIEGGAFEVLFTPAP